MSVGLCMQLRLPPRAKALPMSILGRVEGGEDDNEPCSDPQILPGAEDLLARWPEVRAMLPEACRELRAVFGSEPSVVLRPFVDPASPEDEPALFLVARTRMPAEEAALAMDRFEEAWWLENAARTDHLHVNLEFV